MDIKVVKILDQGTDNPIVNRMYLQFAEMTRCGFFWIEDEKQREFRGLLYKLMIEMLNVEKYSKEYSELEGISINKVNSSDGIKYQKNGFSYDDPSMQLHELFNNFLIKCVISIRKFVKVGSYILDIKFNGHKDLSKYIIKTFNPETHFYKWFEERGKYIKEIYDLRGLAEHEELKLSHFEVELIDKKVKIILPKISDTEVLIKEYIESCMKFLFNYFEHSIAQFLTFIYNGYGMIRVLSEEEMRNHRNFKYIIDLNVKAK